MIEELRRLPGEKPADYCFRVYNYKDENPSLTWMEAANIINSELGYNYSADKYRKDSYSYFNCKAQKIDTCCMEDYALDEMRLERTRLSDERSQITAMYRRISREDSIKEMASDIANQLAGSIKLPAVKTKIQANQEKEAILEISDWHYGIEIENYWNIYNPDIAKERIAKLRDKTIEICTKEKISTLNVVNLGDLIAGRIHTQLRINSRFDVITQIIEVSELLAQMLSDLSEKFNINYYDTEDNHSRLEPNIKESLDLETLTRITTWFLKERLKNNNRITIHGNEISDDIISFEVLGHKVCGVHGHKDKPAKIIDNLTLLTKQHFDLVLAAHFHHFNCEEKNETVLVSNSSLMGTDDYAERLRLNAVPSQALIICTPENPVSCIYKINLD